MRGQNWSSKSCSLSVKSALTISSPLAIFLVDLNEPSVILESTQHRVGWADHRLPDVGKGIWIHSCIRSIYKNIMSLEKSHK